MNWYVLIKGEIKADNLNKEQAFKICMDFSKKNPDVDVCRILMCRKLKRNGKEMYCKSSFEDFHENSLYNF